MIKEEKYWTELARFAISNRPLILVGIGVDQLRSFEVFGGQIKAAVCVLPPNLTFLPFDEAFPVLKLESRTQDIFQIVVDDFAKTLCRNKDQVIRFFNEVDCSRESVVVSYLPLPHALLDGRQGWAQDSGVSRWIEKKSNMAEILQNKLAVVPGEIVSRPFDLESWNSLVERLGTSKLVLQQTGLNGGGLGTCFCVTYPDACKVLSKWKQHEIKISERVEGTACNIMGSIIDLSRTLILPLSRQLVSEEDGLPIYAGNDFSPFLPDDEIAEITREVRQIGKVLAERGFRGPFGLDFIRKSDGTRLYHDINPRMNGAVDSLAFYFSRNGCDPLRVLLLGRHEWKQSDIDSLEETLLYHVSKTPLVRFFLSKRMNRKVRADHPLSTGIWKIGMQKSSNTDNLVLLEQPNIPTSSRLKDMHIWFNSLAPAGMITEKNERLILGDLYCACSTVNRLKKTIQRPLHELFFDALFH